MRLYKTRPDGRQGQALVYGSWFGSRFMNLGSVHGSVHGLVYDLVYGLVHGFDSGMQFMVHGVLHNVLLEHGGLPCIFPFNVHLDLDFGHHCDTQCYLRLLSEPCNPTQTI